MRALVTLAIGNEYAARFEQYCRPAWSAYAKRCGYDLFVFNSTLDQSVRASSRPIYWQKHLILEQETLAKYQQVAFIDSDIVINVNTAPPVFEGVPEERLGAVDEYPVPDAVTYRRALVMTYLRARRLRQPFLHNLTPEEFYRRRGFPEFGEVVQSGMFVCSPRHHREILRKIHEYEDTSVPTHTLEMAAMSYEFLSRKLVTWIDYRFNRLVLLGIAESLTPLPANHRGPSSHAEIEPCVRLSPSFLLIPIFCTLPGAKL